MDTLTHIVLGACIGEIVAGKHLGRKALLIGAVAQNIPDIDFIASSWLSTVPDLCAHRGFTHSFLFMALVTPVLSFVSIKLFRSSAVSFKRWLLFWGIQIFIHLFIDAFNVYGTGWFVPFSSYRVTFNTLFVADPLLSLWPFAASIALMTLKTTSTKRKPLAWTALGISTVYLLSSIGFKLFIDSLVKMISGTGKSLTAGIFPPLLHSMICCGMWSQK